MQNMNNQKKIHMAALIIWAGLLIDMIDLILFEKEGPMHG